MYLKYHVSILICTLMLLLYYYYYTYYIFLLLNETRKKVNPLSWRCQKTSPLTPETPSLKRAVAIETLKNECINIHMLLLKKIHHHPLTNHNAGSFKRVAVWLFISGLQHEVRILWWLSVKYNSEVEVSFSCGVSAGWEISVS